MWADECHELLLRQRFALSVRRPRVIWLPRKKDDLGYLQVITGEATFRENSLLKVLREYGVEITRSQEEDVKEDLLAYALAKLDEPFSKWK